jgi:flagellar basal-body rod protein FlgF
MDRSLYVAMTGAAQILQAQSVVAQNLANVSTPGFRADLYGFASLQVAGPGLPTRVNAVATGQGFNSMPGMQQQTGLPLDVAVRGSGYLAVQASDGTEAYTRAGDLQVAADGTLKTATGLPVLGDSGPITIPTSDSVAIGADGTITVVPQGVGPKGASPIARLKLVNPAPGSLVKGTDGLLRTKSGTPAASDANVQVQSGMLESSNVNAPRALVDMIQFSRLFDMQVKLMNAVDQNAQDSQKLLSPA